MIASNPRAGACLLSLAAAIALRPAFILEGAILLVRTGFSQRRPDKAACLGTAERSPIVVPKLHLPGLSAVLTA
ncbi:hypothetical protein GRI39_05045 [Altererythrobacter indicus]|uniref:Uncharacterized protein n=1 Tax=Altericroceibacterium indicum TaxID=374177 RepID=A0A845A7W3_9SPHN|nr:hypothetical protein [Altericroceibacterium indicum]MXP25409.1 hypothetical protein [Altericroceibacterium indicum]